MSRLDLKATVLARQEPVVERGSDEGLYTLAPVTASGRLPRWGFVLPLMMGEGMRASVSVA